MEQTLLISTEIFVVCVYVRVACIGQQPAACCPQRCCGTAVESPRLAGVERLEVAARYEARPRPFFMVARSLVRPPHPTTGVKVDWGLVFLAALSAVRFPPALMAKATGEFPSFPGERPSVGAMKEWLETARDQLTADQRSLVDGYSPRGCAALEPDTVPGVLVEGGSVTARTCSPRCSIATCS